MHLPLILGVALLFAGGFVAVALTFVAISGWDYIPYAPTWVVLSQACSGTQTQRTRAFKELDARVASPAASPIVERALVIQADRSIPWDSRWGDLAEHAKRAGTVAPGQWERYLGQIVWFNECIRPRVALSDGVFVRIINSGEYRCGNDVTGVDRFRIITLLILRCGNVETTAAGPKIEIADVPTFHGPQKIRFSPTATTQFGSGTRSAQLEHSWEVVGIGPLAGIGHGSQRQTTDLAVAPAGESVVHFLARPDLATPVEQCLEVRGFGVQTNPGATSCGLEIRAKHSPVDLAFQAFLVSNGREIDLGLYAFRSGVDSTVGRFIDPQSVEGVAPGSVEIVLRPSAEAAAETTDIFDVYGAEIREKATFRRD